MREVKINFLPEQEAKKAEKTDSKRDWKKILAAIAIVMVICIAVFSSSIAFSNESLIKNLSKLGFIGQMGKLITSADKNIQGESIDRVNFVLIGIGGKAHDGGTLADTIILGSFKPSTKQIALISIPRDMYVKPEGWNWMKVNAVHAYAERDQENSGGEFTSNFFSKLLNTSIDYYAVVDFDAFERIIDEFGGVDVTVDRDLIDYQYPIRGKEDIYPISSRFEKLYVKKGPQHMDGALALKYARSRHALGIEGSDFARSRRQQKIILALKDKIISINTLFNPKKINSLLMAYQDHVNTNMQIWEMLRLAQLGKDVDLSQAITYGLGDGNEALLYPQIVGGAYVLLPYGGSYEKIAELWANIFDPEIVSKLAVSNKKWEEFKDYPLPKPASTTTTTLATTTGAEQTTTTESEAEVTPENTEENDSNSQQPEDADIKTFKTEAASIEIQNGTNIGGWAGQEKSKLGSLGFNISQIGNSAARDYASIKIYKITAKSFPLTAAELKKIYGVSPADSLPAGVTSNADFLIILGK